MSRQAWALAVALLVAAAACGGGRRVPDEVVGTPYPPPARNAASPPQQTPNSPRPGRLTARPVTPLPTPPPEGGGAPPAVASSDDDAVGANAAAYLRGSVPRLVVEVDAVAGQAPSSAALAHLRSTLASVADKPGGIELRPTEQIPAGGQAYDEEALRALERRYRQTHSTPEAASLYVLFVNGQYSPDRSVLALSYSASAFAVFVEAERRAAGPLVSREQIERAVLVHEAGHLLRLVNIDYVSPRPHEDPEHPHHSRNPRSVMYWAVESDLVSTILNGPPADTFDPDDLADLDDLKAGRL